MAATRPTRTGMDSQSGKRRIAERLLLGITIAAAIGVAAVGYLIWQQSAYTKAPVASKSAPGTPQARFVGQSTCVSCHGAQADAWRGSQHAQAMQAATPATVLGRFDGTRFTYNGVTSTFFRKEDHFFVRTDGPDGKLADFEVKYTFGVYPLQQYLVPFPDGRMQALSIAWDARPKSEGGGRWFHLYPNERIHHRDPLHWTRLNQNWNTLCAECHSTNLQRNYDTKTDRFATTWTDINVACEACHGPGSNHLAWAKKEKDWEKLKDGKGLVIQLDERKGVSWAMDAAGGSAKRSRALDSQRELETCAVCHSRRGTIGTDPGPTGRLQDTHDLSLLREGLYHADGQQLDEVYNHSSFLQSKMHAKGVTCSDCHDPHTQKLRAPGNAVCAQCHAPAKFDATAHHLHPAGGAGAQCAACHMPTRTYMVVDPRHDHSLRVPRPDLTLTNGTPNACNACHRDRDPAWAAAAIEKAHGPGRKGFQTFAEALRAGRSGARGAQGMLIALAGDATAPAIARATAVAELRRFPGRAALPAIEQALLHFDPLLRAAALDTLLAFPPDLRATLAERLADDPVKVVRIKAGRALAAAPLDGISPEQRGKRERAFAEYVASQEAVAERPEAHANLGTFYTERGDNERAEAQYRQAIRLQPDFVPAYVNLADLYRLLGREPDAAATLTEGLKQAPGDASLLHALGLQRAREKRTGEALALLKRATDTQPANAHFAYVYGVALHSSGKPAEGITALERGLVRSPNDPDLLFGLAAFNREAGRLPDARDYARRFAAVAPHDERAQPLLRELGEK
jgi:Flp pilus assembly protein TadD